MIYCKVIVIFSVFIITTNEWDCLHFPKVSSPTVPETLTYAMHANADFQFLRAAIRHSSSNIRDTGSKRVPDTLAGGEGT